MGQRLSWVASVVVAAARSAAASMAVERGFAVHFRSNCLVQAVAQEVVAPPVELSVVQRLGPSVDWLPDSAAGHPAALGRGAWQR
jgi:hypothetical protein